MYLIVQYKPMKNKQVPNIFWTNQQKVFSHIATLNLLKS